MRSLLCALICIVAAAAAKSERPNVIVILADDMGYGDVRALNPKSRIPTPALDSLATDGATFLDAHTPSSVCTPTRYGLLTGRYCCRSRLKRGVLNSYGAPLMTPDRVNLGGFLNSKGDATGMVGKWHLGLGLGFQKNGKEFDFRKPYHLSNLRHDPGETKNFIEAEPSLARELESAFKEIHENERQ